jgi:hypothetical protein
MMNDEGYRKDLQLKAPTHQSKIQNPKSKIERSRSANDKGQNLILAFIAFGSRDAL